MALCWVLDCAGEDAKAEASRPGIHKQHTCVVKGWLLVSPASPIDCWLSLDQPCGIFVKLGHASSDANLCLRTQLHARR